MHFNLGTFQHFDIDIYKMIKELKLGIKEISSKILESFRREHLTFEDISLLNQHIKIHDL